MAIISFTKVDLPYGYLGNMAPFPITFNDKEWKTSEALFQALRFDDILIQEEIRKCHSPMSAKMISKKLEYRNKRIIEPMSDLDIENMRLCLYLKFNQHLVLKEKLINTGNHTLIEDIGKRRGERHLFWGCYHDIQNKWIGNNMLGKLLMEMRDKFKMDG